jgi:hypothetical protein
VTSLSVNCENSTTSTQKALGGGGNVTGAAASAYLVDQFPLKGSAAAVQNDTPNGWQVEFPAKNAVPVTAYVVCVP